MQSGYLIELQELEANRKYAYSHSHYKKVYSKHLVKIGL